MLNAILKPTGFTIDKATSGLEALTLSLKNDYDLFILDVQMPGMNGFELAENIKSINRTKNIPIIFLTAINKEDKFSIQGYEAGAVDYLTKPINDELLLVKVNLFLELYHQKKHIIQLNKELEQKVEFRTTLLNQRTEILEGIFNNADIGIAILTFDGLVIESNNYFNNLFEKDAKYIMGLNYKDFIIDEYKNSLTDICNQLRENEIINFNQTIPHQIKNGVQKYFKLKANKINYSNLGDCILLLVEDVNDQLISQEKIRKSEIQKSGILTSIKNQIALIDAKGNIILTNEAWDDFSNNNPSYTIFGGAIGENCLDKIKEEEKNDPIFLLVHRGFLRVLSGKEDDFHMEYMCKLPTGNRWFFIRATHYGNKEGVVVSLMDITDRKNSEELILLSENKLKDIVNNISDAIFSVDNNFKIISWNKSCENIYGYSEREALNKKMDELLKTEFIHTPTKEIIKILTDKKQWSGEVIQLNKICEPLFINTNYKIIYNNKKENIGITILNKDITSIRKNEIELTNALILGEEGERKRIASNLHDGLGQYLSGLRMHLQVIKTDISEEYYTNLISLIDTAIKEYRSVSHNIIPPNLTQDGLVDAIKLTCDKINSETVQFNITSNLEDIKITSEVEMELYRITQELINNALKHSEAKKIDIAFSINNSNLLTIKITDDGKGFDVEQNINKTKTGIGLKNILSRIHFLKGTIKITSKLGVGSQFIMKIKL